MSFESQVHSRGLIELSTSAYGAIDLIPAVSFFTSELLQKGHRDSCVENVECLYGGTSLIRVINRPDTVEGG